MIIVLKRSEYDGTPSGEFDSIDSIWINRNCNNFDLPYCNNRDLAVQSLIDNGFELVDFLEYSYEVKKGKV